MKQEIERKYTIKQFPEELKINKILEIEQVYLYRDNFTNLRVRKIINKNKATTQYIYTVKTKGDIDYTNNYQIGRKYEIENEITEEEYNKLKRTKISNIINKTRLIIPIEQELKVEIDIYYGYLEGLLIAEIEFPNLEMANTYKKPNWLGEELGYKEFSNRKLAEMTREELLSKVTEEFMNTNKKVIEKIHKKL